VKELDIKDAHLDIRILSFRMSSPLFWANPIPRKAFGDQAAISGKCLGEEQIRERKTTVVGLIKLHMQVLRGALVNRPLAVRRFTTDSLVPNECLIVIATVIPMSCFLRISAWYGHPQMYGTEPEVTYRRQCQWRSRLVPSLTGQVRTSTFIL
jgi:hypothetical protein